MEIVGAEAEFVGQVAGEMKGLDFNSWPVAVQRRVLQNELSAAAVVPDFDLIESLRLAPGKFFSISSALSVTRDVAGKIKLRTKISDEFCAEELRLQLQGGAGQAVFGGRKFVWQFQPFKSAARFERQTGLEFFDADKIGAKIILRHWRAGDRFQPSGMKSAVKLQDLFVNAKISAGQRRRLVLAATAAGDIFWVDGLRIGEKFKLTPATGRRLAWRHSKIAG